ncbi:MAG: peptidyl-prolyl cis-trans isomerase [Candidatus Omnitrophota bacterium]
MKKIILLSLLLFLLINSLWAVEDKVVAIVNNEAVTKAELDAYISLIKLQIGYEGWLEFNLTERMALEKLIEDRLVLQEAKRKKIEMAPRLIDSRTEEVKQRFNSKDEFSDFLANQGLSLSEMRKRLEEKMLSDKLIEMEVRRWIFISPKEVTEYYQEHINDFYLPERVRIESIFVADTETAGKIYERLKEGASFLELQSKYSEKASLGLIEKGQLVKEIEDVIFSLQTQEFSKPIKMSGGYYIFKVEEKSPPSNRSLVETQPAIKNMLLERKFNKLLTDYVEKLKKNSYIVFKDE